MAIEETTASTGKRLRDPEVEVILEAKRLHADLLFDILDDVEDRSADHETRELETVMRSLEEEIGFPSSPTCASPEDQDREDDLLYTELISDSSAGNDDGDGTPNHPELGYLLEASDDDLGLPPTVSDGDLAEDEVSAGESVDVGQAWGFEDEMPSCYDAFDIGFDGRDVNKNTISGGGVTVNGSLEQEGLLFHGGLFDDEYTDLIFHCQSDLSWQPEYLPAV